MTGIKDLKNDPGGKSVKELVSRITGLTSAVGPPTSTVLSAGIAVLGFCGVDAEVPSAEIEMMKEEFEKLNMKLDDLHTDITSVKNAVTEVSEDVRTLLLDVQSGVHDMDEIIARYKVYLDLLDTYTQQPTAEHKLDIENYLEEQMLSVAHLEQGIMAPVRIRELLQNSAKHLAGSSFMRKVDAAVVYHKVVAARSNLRDLLVAHRANKFGPGDMATQKHYIMSQQHFVAYEHSMEEMGLSGAVAQPLASLKSRARACTVAGFAVSDEKVVEHKFVFGHVAKKFTLFLEQECCGGGPGTLCPCPPDATKETALGACESGLKPKYPGAGLLVRTGEDFRKLDAEQQCLFGGVDWVYHWFGPTQSVHESLYFKPCKEAGGLIEGMENGRNKQGEQRVIVRIRGKTRHQFLKIARDCLYSHHEGPDGPDPVYVKKTIFNQAGTWKIFAKGKFHTVHAELNMWLHHVVQWHGWWDYGLSWRRVLVDWKTVA